MEALRKIENRKKSSTPKLRVIRGGKYQNSKIETRVNQFWQFCHACLWNNEQFTEEQTSEFKKLIAEYFTGIKNTREADKTFRELIERVCLAKRYVNRRPYRFISKPIDWLNINYKNGLAGTAKWYSKVEEQRKTVPHYNEGISLLSRAVLAYCDLSSPLVINLHREVLMEEKQTDLLQIFMNTVMHIRYFKN